MNALTSKTNQEILNNPQRLNRYAYGLNNPYKYIDPDGEWAEAVFIDGPSIAVGVHSFVSNVKQGNVGSAVVDAVGIVADTAAAIAPGIPGGVGLGIKASRGAEKTVRLRHFTNSKGAEGIMREGVIRAGDKNSVFSVLAKGKAGSARDVENALGIRQGRGNSYIEFNAKSSEFMTMKNTDTGATEKIFRGDVNLQGRNAKKHNNR